MSTPTPRSDAPENVTVPAHRARRKALRLLPAPAGATVAPGPHPLDVALAELWAGFEVAERTDGRAGGRGAGVMIVVKAAVDVRDRLVAERGEDFGSAVWRLAMRRHTSRVETHRRARG